MMETCVLLAARVGFIIKIFNLLLILINQNSQLFHRLNTLSTTSVAILVSEILDLVSTKRFWYDLVSDIVQYLT